MIIEAAVLAVVAAVAYFGGTTSGKAEVAAVKAKIAAELPKIEASVTAAEATVKADVLAVVAKLKSL